ncbi:MAG: galactose ABC transporter substrate-binding protein [Deltaproteobacteria bacterium]|jgi:methyl-galactoside transport system substrate-binding protein|nr:galactose ABC transporter substrate-binding protein [Deltaproteobacteria bacterium]
MNRQNKKLNGAAGLLALLLILALGGILSACSDSETQDDPTTGQAGGETAASVADSSAQALPVVGVLLYDESDTYISLVCESLVKSFAGKAELIIRYADGDQLTQNEQLEDLLKKPVNALVFNLVDVQAAANIVDRIKKSGIPVVLFNREPDMSSIKTYDRARFVGTALNDAGILQGDLIYKLWNEHPEYDRNQDGQVQYVMIQAATNNPESVIRTEYSVKRAVELGLTMSQLGDTYMCNWSEELAREAMRLALIRIEGEVELVIANSDAMALGAIAALAEKGYNTGDGGKFIPVVGVDATPQAVEAIKKGIMSATVRQDAMGMGKITADMTLNAIAGKDFLADTNLEYDESGVAVRLSFTPYYGE